MDYIDEFAILCLRQAARSHLWATPEWGALFESDEFAHGLVLDELRQAVRADFVNPSGNFDAALDIADTILMGFINSKLVRFEPIPQGWPKHLPPRKSGLPHKPSSIGLIQHEFQRRCTAGMVQKTIISEARVLSDWLKKYYPQHPQATEKTVANHIRKLYTAYRAKNPIRP